MSEISRTGWNHKIHALWQSGNRKEAIQKMVYALNQHPSKKPKTAILQLGYYLFLINDYASGANLFKTALQSYPADHELLSNLAVYLSRGKNYKEAVQYVKEALVHYPEDYLLWDILAASHYHLNNEQEASDAGTSSLNLKDKRHSGKLKGWSLPKRSASQVTSGKKRVISFCLWGKNTRYLHGALRNLLLAPDIYPGWELWFYVDSSIPSNYLKLMKHLGAHLIHKPENQPLKDKLCWRFQVANASDVGYFLIRDADSVISVREQRTVQEWLESDRFFHVIRDWWTHTDLILAGLWGGVAGVLPDIQKKLANYSSVHLETPNIDQWFLRDELWRYIRKDCLIHDRCFKQQGSQPFPGLSPTDSFHVGCCEGSKYPKFQEKMLAPWLEYLKKL